MFVPAIVTGASGFVGRVLARQLGAARSLSLAAVDWEAAAASLAFRDAVVYHLAARVHGRGAVVDEYRRDNVDKTRALAERAAREGAQAFVFLSTIKVHGEETRGAPFRPDDPPRPEDAYARSKLAAEQALAEIAARTGLRVAVVRSPLVYGREPRGNLAALRRLADTPWPLPFAALDAPRSFVHVEDLCRALTACAGAPASGVYLAAHPLPVATASLVQLLRRALGRAPRLFPVPAALLEAAGAMVGQGERARRLTRALVVDPSRLQRELGWSAQVDIDAAVRDLAAA